MTTEKPTRESSGFFENKKIKTVIYLKDGKLITSYYYGRREFEQLKKQELLDNYIKHPDEWKKTNEYIYIEPEKGGEWIHPYTGMMKIG